MTAPTLICTVYNEGGSIEELLESIQEQSLEPDEVVIVDGGSDDGTYELLQSYEEQLPYLNVVQEPGCNIAEGRNIAVKHATNKWIVGTDGGCVLDEYWYEAMTEQFRNGAEYVIGMFQPLYNNLFEKVQGAIVCSPHTVEELRKGNRGPSSRSVGFTKDAWETVNGYPEDLYTGEDSKFNATLLAAGYKPAIAEDAVVYWRMRPTWRSLYTQFYRYGEGDARGGNLFTHPSSKLGLTKNLYLVTDLLLAITAAILFSLTYTQTGTISPAYSTAAVLLLATPTLYYTKTLAQVAREDGVSGLITGIGITQAKTWGFFLGFWNELLRHPSLIPKQVSEAWNVRDTAE